MFNICDVDTNKNHVCLCEAGKACKGGDTTCSPLDVPHAAPG